LDRLKNFITRVMYLHKQYLRSAIMLMFLARFSLNSRRRRLLVTDSVYPVRASISRCAPSPCYGIACTCTLLHRVLLVTAPTKDPSIFPQSRRKFSRRTLVSLISLIVPGASFEPGTIIAGYIKSLYTR